MSTKRAWLDLLFTAGLVGAVVVGRGLFVAQAIDGRYSWWVLITDLLAVALFVALLRLFDLGMQRLALRLLGDETRGRRIAGQTLRHVSVLFVAGSFFLTTFQLHPPKIATTSTPADYGLDYQDVQIESQGMQLAGWLLEAEAPERPVVIVAHGLGANRQNFLPAAVYCRQLGYHALIFDFRAHGDSPGRTASLGYNEAADVLAAHDWAKRRFPGQPIYAVGFSGGAAAVLQATAQAHVFDKLVIDSTFSSVQTAAHASTLKYLGPVEPLFWQLARGWAWLWTGVDMQSHRPVDALHALTDRPVMLIHGTADPVIPFSEFERLQAGAPPGTEVWILEGAGHVGSLNDRQYFDRLKGFLGSATAEVATPNASAADHASR